MEKLEEGQRFFPTDWRSSRSEETHHGFNQGNVVVRRTKRGRGICTLGDGPFFAVDCDARGHRAGSEAQHGPDGAIGPEAGEDVGLLRLGSGEGETARTEHGEQGFSRMNPVPEPIWVGGLNVTGTNRKNMQTATDIRRKELKERGTEPVQRRGKHWHARRVRCVEHGHGILERGCEGLVHEDGFAVGEEGFELLSVFASVDGVNDEGVDLFGHGGEGFMKLDAVDGDEFVGKAFVP